MKGVVVRKVKLVSDDERRSMYEIMNGELNIRNIKILKVKKGEQIFPYITIIFSINHKFNKKNSTVIGCKIVNPEVCKCLKGGI